MFCTICNEMKWNQLNFFFWSRQIHDFKCTSHQIVFFFKTKLKVKIQKKRCLINGCDDPTSWEFNREKMIIFSITIATMRLKSETMPKPTFANQHHLKWVFISNLNINFSCFSFVFLHGNDHEMVVKSLEPHEEVHAKFLLFKVT